MSKPTNGVLIGALAVAIVTLGLVWAPEANAQVDWPDGASRHSLVSNGDPMDGELWLFGGMTDNGTSDQFWRFTPVTETWAEVDSDSKKVPKRRRFHTSAYDPNLDLVIIFGGATPKKHQSPEILGDTWSYDPAANTWSGAVDCPSGGSVVTAAPGGGNGRGKGGGGPGEKAHGPPARWSATMAYNEETDEVTLFGGVSEVGAFLDDTWTLQIIDGQACWIDQGTSNLGPSPRRSTAMAYVSRGGAQGLVLYGGADQSTQDHDDMWLWDGNAWSEINQNGGPKIRGHSLMYDPNGDRLMIVGGELDPIDDGQPNDLIFYYDFVDGMWSQESLPVTPIGAGEAATYDPGTDSIILYGGTGGNLDYGRQTWVIPLEVVSSAECFHPNASCPTSFD